jgi:hypothetical protein
MLEPQVDRIFLEAVVLDVPQPCSIAAVRRLCMEPVVSEQRCKTFLIKFGRLNHDQ